MNNKNRATTPAAATTEPATRTTRADKRRAKREASKPPAPAVSTVTTDVGEATVVWSGAAEADRAKSAKRTPRQGRDYATCEDCGVADPTVHDVGDLTLCASCSVARAEARLAHAGQTRTSDEAASKLRAKPANEARPLGTPAPVKAKPAVTFGLPAAPKDGRLVVRHALGHVAAAGWDTDVATTLLDALSTIPVVVPTPVAVKPTREPKEVKPKAAPRPCACGCGALTGGGWFRPGHDARFHGWIAKLTKGTETVETLKTKGVADAAFTLMTLVDGRPTTDYDGSAL